MMSRLLSQTMSGFPPHMLLGNLTMSNPALSTDPMTGSADLAWPPHLSPHPLLTPPPGGLPHIANNCIELARVQSSPSNSRSEAKTVSTTRLQRLLFRKFQHNLITKQVLFLSVTAANPS